MVALFWDQLSDDGNGKTARDSFLTPDQFIRLYAGRNVNGDSSTYTKDKFKEVGKEDSSPCKCRKNSITHRLNSHSKQRRERELADWRRLYELNLTPLTMCEAFTPLRYPASGVTVQPLESTRLYGLELHDAVAGHGFLRDDQLIQIVIRCRYSKGILILNENKSSMNIKVSGSDSTVLTIAAKKNEIKAINHVLTNLYYKSMVYDINTWDMIYVTFLNWNLSIYIHIKKPEVPKLYDPGPSDDINSHVTVITKTFERYRSVKELIYSVHKYYPNITIIVADDSEFPEKISLPNVKHFIMPFAEGWFAGRNLALSQVRTKYFVWVDDDFVFTKGTRLENFLEKFQHPNLTIDLVGGTFGDEDGQPTDETNQCYGCRTLEVHSNSKNSDGNCLILTRNNYHAVKEFPKCFFADGTTNFFMARTSPTRSVGFDPFYDRLGHGEFHIDGLGKLRMMGCTDVNILHKRATNKKYQQYRNLGQKFIPNRDPNEMHTLFKNNLKCFNY
ncbi:beta-1,4 N-acetylgalactosaminyltransferase 1-like [Glandiceps talaboti]